MEVLAVRSGPVLSCLVLYGAVVWFIDEQTENEQEPCFPAIQTGDQSCWCYCRRRPTTAANWRDTFSLAASLALSLPLSHRISHSLFLSLALSYTSSLAAFLSLSLHRSHSISIAASPSPFSLFFFFFTDSIFSWLWSLPFTLCYRISRRISRLAFMIPSTNCALLFFISRHR